MGATLIFLGILVFSAHLFAMIFSKKKIPDVLLLLIIGVLIGPVFKLVSPSDFGAVGGVFTSITLIVILFEGGTGISISDLNNSWKPTALLTFTGFIVAALVVMGVCMSFGMNFLDSITLGAILGGTSSAVVIPLAQHLRLSNTTKTSLILESAITDVLCIVFALAFIDAARMGANLNVGKIAGNVIASFVLATFLGFISAMIWASLLQKIRSLRNSMFLTPAYLFIIYGLAEVLGYSGAIASLSFGITIANMDYFKFKFLEKYQKDKNLKLNENETSFVGEISFVLKTFFFVYIGISIPFSDSKSILIGGLITVFLLLSRIIIAKFCSPKDSNLFDKSTIALMIPKGLAAAVLASVPEQLGMPSGAEIKYITFSVVLFSILICSIMILLIEKQSKLNILFKLIYEPRKKKVKKEELPQEIKEELTEEKNEEISEKNEEIF